MINALLTSVALLAGASVVNAVGSAVVVNQCSFPVDVANVPASGGGQNQIGPMTLQTGGRYSQVYTQLSNGNGWSIKCYLNGNIGTLVQYEYTFHNDGTIWYDLSAVNGDPFNGNWAISSDGGCDPRQAAYQYPTDDANGMQSCADSATITVTLCGAGGAAPAPQAPAPSGGAPAPQAPSAPAPQDQPPAAPASSPVESPAPFVPSAPIPSVPAVPAASNAFGPPANKLQGSPTTFDTRVAGAAATVTNVHTKIVTQFVTVSPVPANAKRSEEHLHRHAARHDHF